MRRTIIQSLLLSISVLAVSACSGAQPQGIEQAKSAAPTPPASITASTLTASDTLTPVSVTQSGELSAPPVTETIVTTTSAAPLTTSAITDAAIEARMARMEEAVGSLRRDYDRIMPAFASLNTTNDRIQTLLDQIETDQGALKAAPVATTTKTTTVYPAMAAQSAPATISPVAPKAGDVSQRIVDLDAPTPLEIASKAQAPAAVVPSADVMDAMATPAPAADYPSMVKGIRLGEHGNKTRLVIDLATPEKPEIVYDIDNNEKLLLVDMPTTGWAGVREGKPKSSSFVSGWSAGAGNKGGTSLAIQLKKDAKIVSTQYIKREGNNPARLVVDLGPAT